MLAFQEERWDSVIYVDSLSCSQIEGKVRSGRTTSLSLVAACIRTLQVPDQGQHDQFPDQMPSVYVKRTSLQELTTILHKKFDWNKDFNEENGYITDQTWYDKGLIVYDSHRPIFDRSITAKEQRVYGRGPADHAITRMGVLPPEIRNMVADAHQTEFDVNKMTAAPRNS